MARFLVMSDVHIEFGDMQLPKASELEIDGVLVAGDVMPWTNCVRWAERVSMRFDVPVVFIAGNHEFYARAHPERTVEMTGSAIWVEAEKNPRIHFLDDSMVTIAGVTIAGGTLWTDFALFAHVGPLTEAPFAMQAAGLGMNDFRGSIYAGKRGQCFTPQDSVVLHRATRRFLEHAIIEASPEVIMTHHAPSMRSVAGRFSTDLMSAAYASNLDDLVEHSGAQLWLHGHMHDSFDYTIGSTRVLCNPRGYLGYELNKSFDPKLVVEVTPK